MVERVAPFSHTRAVRVGARKGKPGWYRHEYHRGSRKAVWRFRDYRLADLNGARPKNHPEIEYNPHGKALLALLQVWVEKNTDDLWVIVALRTHADGRQEVHLRPYGSHIVTRTVFEKTLRSDMIVWDKAALRNQRRARTLAEIFTIEETVGFGINPVTGDRVSD